MSWTTDYSAEAEKKTAEALDKAERVPIASGKELFDLLKFEPLLNHGPKATNEPGHRANCYIYHAELHTLAEYVKHLLETCAVTSQKRDRRVDRLEVHKAPIAKRDCPISH